MKVMKVGTAHIPKGVRESVSPDNNVDEFPYVKDAHTALFFNPNVPPEEILKSLEVLKEDIKLRIEDDE